MPTSTSPTTAEYVIQIGGMTCASCVGRVERALTTIEGVADASVNLATERARVTASSDTSPAELVDAITRAGYRAEMAPTADAPSQPDTKIQIPTTTNDARSTTCAASGRSPSPSVSG
jgi:P-type Cu+ transporter